LDKASESLYNSDMPSHPIPRRVPLDDPLLRAAYARRVAKHKDYARWLYDQGIDPETGKMNGAGRELYGLLLEREAREHETKRAGENRTAQP
jgi:hypothetical protein